VVTGGLGLVLGGGSWAGGERCLSLLGPPPPVGCPLWVGLVGAGGRLGTPYRAGGGGGGPAFLLHRGGFAGGGVLLGGVLSPVALGVPRGCRGGRGGRPPAAIRRRGVPGPGGRLCFFWVGGGSGFSSGGRGGGCWFGGGPPPGLRLWVGLRVGWGLRPLGGRAARLRRVGPHLARGVSVGGIGRHLYVGAGGSSGGGGRQALSAAGPVGGPAGAGREG